MSLSRFEVNQVTPEQLAQSMDELGYVILDNVLSELEIKRLQRELEPYFTKRPNSQAEFFGYKTKRIEALFSKSTAVQNMAMHSIVLDVVDHVLAKNCDSIQINLTQGIRINPGERAQILHPDSAMFPIKDKPFEFVVNAIWAYNKFRKENGATMIVPKSHLWPEDRTPEPHEVQYAEMEPGSVLIYAASLLHGGGANISNQSRTGVAIGYCLGWLRQSENQYLSYPLEVVKKFPIQLQELIGYRVHRPNLGWTHGHEPMDLLTGKDTSHLGAQDFLTDEQKLLLQEYNSGQEVSLTSHNL